MASISLTDDPGHPMSTAPKDGTFVLIYGRNMNYHEAQYVTAFNPRDLGGKDEWNSDGYIWRPWRWWPLPNPPPEPN